MDFAAENKPTAINPNPTINIIKLGVKFPDLGMPEAVDGTDFLGGTVGLALLTVGVGFLDFDVGVAEGVETNAGPAAALTTNDRFRT